MVNCLVKSLKACFVLLWPGQAAQNSWRGLLATTILCVQEQVRRLQEELEGQQLMLLAKGEAEALLKAEIHRLGEEAAELREEAAVAQAEAADTVCPCPRGMRTNGPAQAAS